MALVTRAVVVAELMAPHLVRLQDRQGGAPVPLIRLAGNKQDPNYLGMITMDSNKCVVLDIRVPSVSLPYPA